MSIHFHHRLPRTSHFEFRPELDELIKWWVLGGRGVAVLRGIGGAGKTALAERFVSLAQEWGRRAAGEGPDPDPTGSEPAMPRSFPPLPDTFVYSFYAEPSTSAFLKALGDWLGLEPSAGGRHTVEAVRDRLASADERGDRRGRVLLVLDGLERVQAPAREPNDPRAGRIEDPELRGLLQDIAGGWTPYAAAIITTRLPTTVDLDLDDEPGQSREIRIENLSEASAAKLLRNVGVQANDEQIRQLLKWYGLHALTVRLLGSQIAAYDGGDPGRVLAAQRINTSAPADDDAEALIQLDDQTPRRREAVVQARRLERIVAWYRERLSAAELAVMKALAVLGDVVEEGVLLGAVGAVWPSEPGSAEPPEASELRHALASLRRIGLVEAGSEQTDADPTAEGRVTHTAHPSVREGFRRLLDVPSARRVSAEAASAMRADSSRAPRFLRPYDFDEFPVLPAESVRYAERLIMHLIAAGELDEAFDVFRNVLGGAGLAQSREGADANAAARICDALLGAALAPAGPSDGSTPRPVNGEAVAWLSELIFHAASVFGTVGRYRDADRLADQLPDELEESTSHLILISQGPAAWNRGAFRLCHEFQSREAELADSPGLAKEHSVSARAGLAQTAHSLGDFEGFCAAERAAFDSLAEQQMTPASRWRAAFGYTETRVSRRESAKAREWIDRYRPSELELGTFSDQNLFARLDTLDGEHDRAIERLERASGDAVRAGVADEVQALKTWLANALLARADERDRPRVERLLADVVLDACRTGSGLRLQGALKRLADLRSAQGDLVEAVRLRRMVLYGRRGTDEEMLVGLRRDDETGAVDFLPGGARSEGDPAGERLLVAETTHAYASMAIGHPDCGDVFGMAVSRFDLARDLRSLAARCTPDEREPLLDEASRELARSIETAESMELWFLDEARELLKTIGEESARAGAASRGDADPKLAAADAGRTPRVVHEPPSVLLLGPNAYREELLMPMFRRLNGRAEAGGFRVMQPVALDSGAGLEFIKNRPALIVLFATTDFCLTPRLERDVLPKLRTIAETDLLTRVRVQPITPMEPEDRPGGLQALLDGWAPLREKAAIEDERKNAAVDAMTELLGATPAAGLYSRGYTVALSLPGELADVLEPVVERLKAQPRVGEILFYRDDELQVELAGEDGGDVLIRKYLEDSLLRIGCVTPKTRTKPWPQREREEISAQVRDGVRHRSSFKVFNFGADSETDPGAGEFEVRIADRDASAITGRILEALRQCLELEFEATVIAG